MKSLVYFLVPFYCFFETHLVGEIRRDFSNFEKSLAHISFEDLDTSELRPEVRSLKNFLLPNDEDGLIERNIRYIFYQKLNRARFLIAPKPQDVIEQIAKVLGNNRKLRLLVERGRLLASDSGSSEEMRSVVVEMGLEAKNLRKGFLDYFIECHSSSYSLKFSKTSEPLPQFVSFLTQADQITAQLSEVLGRYFFDHTPGAVVWTDFEETSVSTLVEALSELSEVARRRIK
jgi:hypothetical protein